MREAREDLAMDRKQKLGRGGDTAPPRLSSSGFRSLATLLRQRVRADEVCTWPFLACSDEGRHGGRVLRVRYRYGI